MQTVLLVLRVLLALVFFTAAIGKFLDRPGSRNALVGFGVPARAASFMAPLLPVAELVVGFALIFRPTARWGAGGGVLLLLIFVGGIAQVVARGLRPSCHCFGIFHSEPAGKRALLRNAALMALAAVVAAAGPGPSLSTWVSARSAAELVAIGLGVVAVALAVFVWRLRQANTRLRESLGAAEAVVKALPPGLPVGSIAPDFVLSEVQGGTVSLSSLTQRGKPVLLVFIGIGCRPSSKMLPDLARWQSSLRDKITIAIISRGAPDHHVYESGVLGMSDVGLMKEFETFQDYRVYGTPSAVLVSPQRRIASSLAQAEPAIEALVHLTLQRTPASSRDQAAAPA
jgi:uncharacterized membrane protein YphA (DoxX/SURF4 family)